MHTNYLKCVTFNCGIAFLPATCKAVVTANQGLRGGKVIELKKMVDAAVAECGCVENVFVMSRTGAEVPMESGRDIKLEEVSTGCVLQSNHFCVIFCTGNETAVYGVPTRATGQ